jgi:hypothetical protein
MDLSILLPLAVTAGALVGVGAVLLLLAFRPRFIPPESASPRNRPVSPQNPYGYVQYRSATARVPHTRPVAPAPASPPAHTLALPRLGDTDPHR